MLQIEDEDRCILVSSARRGEGKSFVTAGIGLLLSQSSRRTAKGVLLIDASFRSPALHQLFRIPNRQGLTDVLAGDLDVTPLIQPIREGLALLTAGGFGGRSTKRYFQVEKMRKLFHDLASHFDRVLVDSAAVLDYPDTCMMVPLFDGILLVAESGVTSVSDLRLARTVVEKAGGRLSGVIMNRSPAVATPARRTDLFPEVFFR
jgi:Mrp family chromosome partitioning ATPase